MLRFKQVVALTFITGLLPTMSWAQSEHIYLIKAFNCNYAPKERAQTGFRLQGLKGIITALHGVADAGRVTAKSNGGPTLIKPLHIVRVDVENDLALLSSSELESKEAAGLPKGNEIQSQTAGTVKIQGHPFGIRILATTLSIRKPPLTPLKNLVPDTPLGLLRERSSPNPLINVLSLQGDILPGHSGAPVLDSVGRVIAVANGGLKEGTVGICWAIPLQDIDWENAPSNRRFMSLARANPGVLFDFDDAQRVEPPPPIDSEETGAAYIGYEIRAIRSFFATTGSSQIGGKKMGKGYALSAPTTTPGEAVFILNGEFNRFRAEVGLSDTYTGKGAVAFSVSGLDEQGNEVPHARFTSDHRVAGQPAQKIDVPVQGVVQLILRVQASKASVRHPFVWWGNARVIK